MAHQRSVKGGRSWFGKAEAKAAGRVTRRQDDLVIERLEQWEEIERAEERGADA